MMKADMKKCIVQLGLLLCVGLPPLNAMADVPEVNISSTPLYSGQGNVHPNLVLDLSVEFPTVGAAYRDAYDETKNYIGYFNHKKCYEYSDGAEDRQWVFNYAAQTTNNSNKVYKCTGNSGNHIPIYLVNNFNAATGDKGAIVGYLNASNWHGTCLGSSWAGGGATSFKITSATAETYFTSVEEQAPIGASGDKFFQIKKDADSNHKCGFEDSFSGNFMNWASSSAIDMMRYALTGGDRIIDEVNRTVLQRAYLKSGWFGSSYFPRKTIQNGDAAYVTPFNESTLKIVSCDNRILFGTGTGVASNAPNCDVDTSTDVVENRVSSQNRGNYLARVQVCGADEGATRTDLCSKYGANYKPEGDLQRYADKIRVGAFGYLTGHDSSNSNLYGGVLRAPVKYLGENKFEAPGFAESLNGQPEWDAETGVFYPDPIGSPESMTSTNQSGVVNYLNKFGRTNENDLGAYKTNDPISELYYESLRYLQGKQPTNGSANTTSAIKALGSDTTDDDFPAYKTWEDPVAASCQKNYIMLIGDVNTHKDGYIPGSSADGSDANRSAVDVNSDDYPELNVTTWLNGGTVDGADIVGIAEFERQADYGNRHVNSNIPSNLASSTSAGSSNGTYHLAGLAYWANMVDIRYDKPTKVRTFMIDVDEGGDGDIDNASRYTVSRAPRNSQMYLAAKYGGFVDRGDSTSSDDARKPDGNPFKTYDFDGRTVLNNDEEWAGTANGTDPSNYFLASQPEKLIEAVHNIFQVASSYSGSISGVTLNTTRITTGDAYVFQPGFDVAKWSGSLLKLQLTYDEEANEVTIQDSAYPTWSAKEVLSGDDSVTPAIAANPTAENRKIYTSKISGDGSSETITFTWTSLSSDQKTYLNASPTTGDDDGLGQMRLNYLRGDRTDEIGYVNGIFRARDGVLGDIVNSNPVWVGAPAAYVNGTNYATFYENYKDRTPVVYVGANDGMLHAFKASTGKELFAYVPNAIIPKLNLLTDSAYSHESYVDGQISIVEAQFGSGAAASWKTVLLGGLGGGAQGVYALDVTNPESFSKALWEFTDEDDIDMGNVTTQPSIVKFKTAIADDGSASYQYFAVVPSGLNNYADDGNRDDKGNAALFLLSLSKSSTASWSKGTNYYKYNVPIQDSTLPNGLSAPAFVMGSDGAVRYAYAGDLQGNLWRFDFADGVSGSVLTGSAPLFTAKDSSGNVQPITQVPKVVFAPGGGYVVLFGTGKYVEELDKTPEDFQTQSFYAIYDTTNNNVTNRSQLAERELEAYVSEDGTDAFTVAGSQFSYGVIDEDATGSIKMGWYMDFPGSGTTSAAQCASNLSSCGTGERSVTAPTVVYDNIFFNTLITGSDPCDSGGGRTYGLCTLSGFPVDGNGSCASDGTGVTGYISNVGMLSSPVLFDIGTDVSARDSIGQRNVTKKYAVFNFGTGGEDGTASAAKINDSQDFSGIFFPSAGRASWREILNYKELRSEANQESDDHE